jgi:hypothetical protein
MTNNLPSTIGPVEFSPENVRLWCADSTKFDPIVTACEGVVAPEDATKFAPTGTVTPLPIALLPSTSFIPKEYRIHIHSQYCINCNTASEWSETYAYNSIEPRMNRGKWLEHLVPVDRFSYNVPVRMMRAPVKQVPACHECGRENLSLSHLPKPRDTAEYARVMAAYQNKFNREPPKPEVKIARISQPKEEKTSKAKYKTIADLL